MTILPMGSKDQSASLRFAEHRCVSENAGEVGDGPDEVTGAVPTASQPLQTKKLGLLCEPTYSQNTPLFQAEFTIARV
jgi:hypothetical protein